MSGQIARLVHLLIRFIFLPQRQEATPPDYLYANPYISAMRRRRQRIFLELGSRRRFLTETVLNLRKTPTRGCLFDGDHPHTSATGSSARRFLSRRIMLVRSVCMRGKERSGQT
ncbi:hypothetical protein F4680DRAFT_300840 [Xylaria scruposa]|nr:hypothetical protein F4680DRAFT_300840 [Xylaria scruposa]